MQIHQIKPMPRGFTILQTTKFTQQAIMTLGPNEASDSELNVHDHSDQTLVLMEGELWAEIGSEARMLEKGDAVLIPAGTPHRFTNTQGTPALTFNVYAPPAYGGGL